MLKIRFRLRTIFHLVLGASICSLAVTNLLPERKPYRVLTTEADWDDLMQQDNAILFVDCTWNAYVKINAIYFEDFALWVRRNTSIEIASTTIGEAPDRVRPLLVKLWEEHNAGPFSLKTVDGAGNLVWFEKGKMVGYELPSVEDNWLENRQSLTKKYFDFE